MYAQIWSFGQLFFNVDANSYNYTSSGVEMILQCWAKNGPNLGFAAKFRDKILYYRNKMFIFQINLRIFHLISAGARLVNMVRKRPSRAELAFNAAVQSAEIVSEVVSVVSSR